ncbi:MAG: peptidase M60 [Armatimonadetes bacterium]|nr:peptidase M60 [Armatimonadota bacterium]
MTLRCTLMAALAASLPAAAAPLDAQAVTADLAHFTDATCTALRPEVKAADLAGFKTDVLRAVAESMLAGTYDPAYRVADYAAYPSPTELGRTLKLGDGFSRYEGITGIVLDAGEHLVLVGPTAGHRLQLLIPDWMRKPAEGIEPTKDPNGWGLHRQAVDLREGANIVHIDKGGLVYVSYYDDQAEKAPRIRVHFPTGRVNGYFDGTKQSNEDWDRLLDHAVSPIMDARGQHIQVAYPVEWFNVHTRSRGVELIRNYDTLLGHHFTFMGLVKYDKVPRNHILARVNFNYYMFRDGDGVAYLGTKSVMGMVANPDTVIKGDPCWGFSHETGHALQMRPQVTWSGMTEVSCNFFSLYTLGKMGNESRIRHQKNYASARKNIIDARISYLQCADVFDRLVPFWQLQLYALKMGKPDFYADLMETMRNRPDAGRGKESFRNQFEFVKLACDGLKLDLTDFFDKWGFFWVGDYKIDDYGKFEFTVTQAMVDECRAAVAAKGYPKPADDVTQIEE